jgi:Tfp pilus assembly ATPase PilU
MIKKIKTNGRATTLKIVVESRNKIEVEIIVSDSEQKKNFIHQTDRCS